MVLRFLVIYERRMDTEGVAVDSAVAGRKLTAEKVADAIKASGIEGKVKHKKLNPWKSSTSKRRNRRTQRLASDGWTQRFVGYFQSFCRKNGNPRLKTCNENPRNHLLLLTHFRPASLNILLRFWMKILNLLDSVETFLGVNSMLENCEIPRFAEVLHLAICSFPLNRYAVIHYAG
jgi:hypothetical protein